ncbi:MAG: tRNA lysidine(34) synthetase TilS [Agathobacter sp.]|nr:tRNA lysidine(34) synthetase TilS [Agathobacter sp.]
MLKELRKRMEELHMLSVGDRVLVGVSGGADSICLLLVLLALQEELNLCVEAIHVEHGIRGVESEADAEYVKNLCKQFDIPCHMMSVDVPAYCEESGLGIEEGARILRYQVFTKLAKKQNAKVALAHHQEDNAETILFQLVRGSSLTGLCGMQPIRKDTNGVCYIRPLLEWHRDDIESFLMERGIHWRVDSTNAQLDYSRNFLRAQVLPSLVQVNTQAVEHINQTAGHLTEIKSYMDAETEKVWAQIIDEGEILSWKVSDFEALHPVLQRQIAYKAITYVAGRKKDITSTHVDEVCKLCRGQSGKRVSLPYDITAWKEFEKVYLAIGQEKNADVSQDELLYEVSADMLQRIWTEALEEEQILFEGKNGERILCQRIEASDAEISRKAYTKWLDYDKIKDGFCIRTRRSGDYFISDTQGHRKKLKEYFIDEKIPLSQRDKRWLIARESEVLWLIGGRISETVKVTQKTKRILKITYDGEFEYE